MTAKVLEQFTGLVKKSVKTLISEMISDRLQIALDREKEDQTKLHEGDAPPSADAPADDASKEDGIETTEEELEGFRIVRAILRRERDCRRSIRSA